MSPGSATDPQHINIMYMKTLRYLVLPAVTAAVLSLTPSLATGQAVDSLASLKNRAVAASPRAREVFPWLSEDVRREPQIVRHPVLADEFKNRAVFASPRSLELFPQLGRTFAGRTGSGSTELSAALANRAVLVSPRTQEQFPIIARSRSLERVVTKGGASDLMKAGNIPTETVCDCNS